MGVLLIYKVTDYFRIIVKLLLEIQSLILYVIFSRPEVTINIQQQLPSCGISHAHHTSLAIRIVLSLLFNVTFCWTCTKTDQLGII
jgi:hypothetical protein